jgi:hypothetical protein
VVIHPFGGYGAVVIRDMLTLALMNNRYEIEFIGGHELEESKADPSAFHDIRTIQTMLGHAD